MLIVGREVGESIIIDHRIKVTALQLGSKLHLAVDAPKDVRISRIKQTTNEMLKLKGRVRRIGETVIIEDIVKVTILETESGLLRFAIDAPKEIRVYRAELCQQRDENCFSFYQDFDPIKI